MDQNPTFTIIDDPIYGSIKISGVCYQFFNTPEFTRLKNIKQLGLVSYVYNLAIHTRYEHSIGVMYLSGLLIKLLRKYTSIDKRTKQLVKLAAMLHDIGHSAFSHLFDRLLKNTSDNILPDYFKIKDHEQRSIYLVQTINDRLKLLNCDEVTFVCNLIQGIIPESEPNRFLYQIVCNSICGVDTDKLDYLRRDCYYSGVNSYNPNNIIFNAKIGKNNDLVFSKTVYNDLCNVFKTRQDMFMRVYYHPTVNNITRIYYCMMKTLGSELFKNGINTDDYTVLEQIKNNYKTKKLYEQLESGNYDHICNKCIELNIQYFNSGDIKKVLFC